MSNKEYNKEQIELLKSNKYVKGCTSKYITFTDEIKIEALKLDKDWVYFKDIFRYFSFPDFVTESLVPKQSLKSWRHRFKNKWLSWLTWIKWRKKWEKIDISKMSKDDYIKYLETKTAYLEELHKSAYWHYP